MATSGTKNGMDTTGRVERRWFANAPGQFCWGDWPDTGEAVLFHQGSGDTLMLNPLGEFLLKRLLIEQRTQSQLAAEAADHFRIANDNALVNAVLESLYTFRSLGLIISDTL